MSRLTDALRLLVTGYSSPEGRNPHAFRGAQSQIRNPQLTSPVSVVVDDSPGWQGIHPAPGDRPWGDIYADLVDALDAWRKN